MGSYKKELVSFAWCWLDGGARNVAGNTLQLTIPTSPQELCSTATLIFGGPIEVHSEPWTSRTASMAEGLGVAASAIEVANLGFKLSHSLYDYIAAVSTADRRIQEIAIKVDLTTAIIQEVGTIFDGPEIKALRKESAVTTAKNTLRECIQIFEEIEGALIRSRKNKFLFPFKTSKIFALSASLESLKSNLSLLLHVLQHARQIATDRQAREEAQDRIRERDEALRALYKELARQDGRATGIFMNLHQDSGAIQKPVQDHKDPDISSTTHPGTSTIKDPQQDTDTSQTSTSTEPPPAYLAATELDSCVSALKNLITHIERVQQAMSNPTPSDHSNHKKNLSSAYHEAAQTLNVVLPRYCDPTVPFSMIVSQPASTSHPANALTSLFGSATSSDSVPAQLADLRFGGTTSPAHSPASPAYSPVSPGPEAVLPEPSDSPPSYRPLRSAAPRGVLQSHPPTLAAPSLEEVGEDEGEEGEEQAVEMEDEEYTAHEAQKHKKRKKKKVAAEEYGMTIEYTENSEALPPISTRSRSSNAVDEQHERSQRYTLESTREAHAQDAVDQLLAEWTNVLD